MKERKEYAFFFKTLKGLQTFLGAAIEEYGDLVFRTVKEEDNLFLHIELSEDECGYLMEKFPNTEIL